MGKTVDNTIFEVSHPEVWSLALRLCADRLKFTIHSDSDDNSLTFGELPFADTSCCYASCIEAAVYDNPFLLQSFGKTSVVTGSDRFLLVPDEMAGGDDDECQRYYDCIYPDDRRNVAVNHIVEAGLSIVYGIDRNIESFLRRTFYNPQIMHCLTPLLTFFKRKDAYGGRNKMFVYVDNGTVQIVVLKSGRVAFANVFPFNCTNDAFYFIANAWQHCELSQNDDELHVVGDNAVRQELLPRLRETMSNVAQVIFPAEMMRLGENVTAAPFDLTILPLCE